VYLERKNSMSHEPARCVQLRHDLEHSRQQQQGKTYLVVKDPATRRYFRFTEAQASILELFMDGPEEVSVIAERASEKLNSVISSSTIDSFCRSLEEKLLLETPEIREKLGAIRGQQLQGRNFLYWKIASVNPERIFAWLLPRTVWAYRPTFQLFALLTIFTGFIITYLNWPGLSGAAPGLFSLYGLILIWPVVFTVTTIHEFSHGLTCCHYGGKVHEVGFMLIYFSPAFYCDVSDSYMFPKRTNRMAVALAGGYAQLTVWGICTIVWRLTDPDVFINKLALIVVVFSGLQTLLNFNPLIKLDGYYMLSDFLEVPNLRSKALRSFWDWIAGNGKSAWSYREKRAQLIYGAASAVFSISLLVYVYSRLYTWATSKYALAGLVIFGIFANFTLRKALVEPMEGAKAIAARASVKRYRNLGIALAAVILSVVVKWELKISADFKIIPGDVSIVSSETEGYVLEVLVHEASVVHKGQVLARLTNPENEGKEVDTLGQLQRARKELDDLLRGTRPELIVEQEKQVVLKKVQLENVHNNKEQLAELQETLAGRKTSLAKAQTDLIRNQSLLDGGLIPRTEFESVENTVKLNDEAVREIEARIRFVIEKESNDAAFMAQDLAVAESRLTSMKAGSRPGEILAAEADVDRLVKNLEFLTRELKKTDILAPIDGIVTTEFVQHKRGMHLDPGDELMQLADISSVMARMMVPQKELEDVQFGNKVLMKLSSYPQVFEGKVEFIAPKAQTDGGQQFVPVRSTLIANKDGILKPDLTGNAKIYCGKRPIIELMTRRIRMWLRTEIWDIGP
jgi:multidrug efflux pump subunit AcrA (membrane-fusion protein)